MSFGEAGGRSRGWVAIVALAALVCALVMPAVAAAEELEVNGIGDEPDASLGIGCAGLPVEECTLRAAIEVSNSTPLVDDSIVFDGSVFEGQLADTIALGTSLPAIEDKVLIEGRQCATEGGFEGPCQGISGPNTSNPALTVKSDGVEIEGLAITGARVGINIVEGSEEVRVKSSWLGIGLGGNAGGNTIGIFIDPESNRDRIGGEAAGTGNVFANNSEDGLQILGADETLVLGNLFGVKPDGVTPAGNGEDVEVASQLAGGFAAERNLIGVQAESEAATTPACDKGCNVIAGATGNGIDLQGDSLQGDSPAVETHVAGNFIGLGADLTTEVANGFAGITVGSAAKTLVGGLEDDESNFIAGAGGFGIYHENANALRVLNNEIGFNPNGVAVDSPAVGMFIFCNTTTEAATIEGNAIGMDPGGIGIEQRFLGATIAENFIEGGQTGILATGSGATGNLIEENLIEGASGNGILLKSDSNEAYGNEVFESGAAGIRVEHAGVSPLLSPTTGNLVGGDSPASENTVSDSGGDAIEIVDFEATNNEVGRNKGSGNKGLFIDLVATDPGTEPDGPNEGVKPPTISVAKQTEASGGGAEPGALVRVFRKASTASGELQSFLEDTVADGAGKWKVTYPGSIPGGTIVVATQTTVAGGTSELSSTATTTPEPSGGGGNGGNNNGGGGGNAGGSGNGGGGGKKGPDTTPPQTKILKGPSGKIAKTTVKFKFNADESGVTFRCKLDGKAYQVCKSPKKYKKLKPGKHVFKVRAVDKAGNIDSTAAKRKFTVVG